MVRSVLSQEDELRLCEQYPMMKLKYIHSIKEAEEILDKIEQGSEREKYYIPLQLEVCKESFEQLKVDRASDFYDEAVNSSALDIIEKTLEGLIKSMEHLTETHDCDIKKKLKNVLMANANSENKDDQEYLDCKNKIENMFE